MNDALHTMLSRYRCHTADEYRSALKEIMQEIALLGLWRAKFFDHAAFYGGTALRILYQLDRFSEDLDFSLLKPNPHFDLAAYEKAIETELGSFGLDVQVAKKSKSGFSPVQSAFIKGQTRLHMIHIGVPIAMQRRFHLDEKLKIKLEVDTDPPPKFATETRYLFQPVPFAISCYCESDLLAGKLHALLCRMWKGRVKGRDWYDFVWFVGRKTPLHLAHLEARMRQSGHYTEAEELSSAKVTQLLEERITRLDIEKARSDVAPFLRDPSSLDLWSKEFFRAAANQLAIL